MNSTTCLSERPKVVTVKRGATASILYEKFNASPVDMESASVALVCLQPKVPFVAIRALSGERNSQSNDAGTFVSLAANNSVMVVLECIKRLPWKDCSAKKG